MGSNPTLSAIKSTEFSLCQILRENLQYLAGLDDKALRKLSILDSESDSRPPNPLSFSGQQGPVYLGRSKAWVRPPSILPSSCEI